MTGYKEVTVPANSANCEETPLQYFANQPIVRISLEVQLASTPLLPEDLMQWKLQQPMRTSFCSRMEQMVLEGQTSLTKLSTSPQKEACWKFHQDFPRGLKFPEKPTDEPDTAQEIENVLEEEPASPQMLSNGVPMNETTATTPWGDESESEEDIDALLPVEFPALATSWSSSYLKK